MKKEISINVCNKRFKRRLISKNKLKKKRIRILKNNLELKFYLGDDSSYINQIEKWLSKTVIYYLNRVKDNNFKYNDFRFEKNSVIIMVPKVFCLNTNIKGSLAFITKLVQLIISDSYKNVVIDYNVCKEIDLSAQICLDALLLDLSNFIKRRTRYKKIKPRLISISGENIVNDNVSKILFSVGSPAIIKNEKYYFEDIVPYHLCVHNKEKESIKNSERKEVDTTRLVEHVIESSKVLNKELSQDTIEDLSTVVGEILINAEEHSTLNHRYSTGFFQKISNPENDKLYGIYHLVIFNFGSSIYEKFKDEDCENIDNVERMKKLSSKYSQKGFFNKQFPESCLWTLYSLQEGVTSTSPNEFVKRGNGSIRFIESFFNLRSQQRLDKISRMNIISGNTSIKFDGKYNITQKVNSANEEFNVMTFNASGDIEEKPDSKYVKKLKTYFPGTVITAKILLTEEDEI